MAISNAISTIVILALLALAPSAYALTPTQKAVLFSGAPSVTFIKSVTVFGNGSQTSASVNMVGANLIVMAFSGYTQYSAPTISDSLSNSYSLATYNDSIAEACYLFYKIVPTVSSSMTFSYSGANNGAMVIAGFKTSGGIGAGALDATNNADAATATSISVGNMIPSVNGEVAFAALGSDSSGPGNSMTTNFGVVDKIINGYTGNYQGVGDIYYSIGPTNTINITASNLVSADYAICGATFKPHS